MKSSNNKILILGAGPAGMACAMELHRNNTRCEIIEHDKKVGGLAKTYTIKEGKYTFRTDIGPHRFFSKNQYLYDFIEDLLDERWICVKRQTRQYIEGKFYDYPINAAQAFKNIGLFKSGLMGLSYINGVVKYRVFGKKIRNFEDYTISNFGRKLGEFNILNYTEKVWGIPCSQIHPDWAAQRIKGLNLVSALKNAIMKKSEDGPKTLVDEFYYPQYGTGLIYETIAQKIVSGGSKIYLENRPTKIKHSKGKITEVTISSKEGERTYHPDKLVSSIPMTVFLGLLDPVPPKKVIDAMKRLKWRSQVYIFMTLDKKRVTTDNWIYFPNKEISFGRISEMKNFSKDMSPKDKTSIFVEYFVNEGDRIWNMKEDELFEMTLAEFEKLGFFKRKDVRKYYVFRQKHVYPIYDLDYKKTLGTVKEYLDGFDNLLYIGRPGRYQYNNQDHSLEMGILAAESILKHRKVNFDDIGSEKEYFEKGSIHKRKKKSV